MIVIHVVKESITPHDIPKYFSWRAVIGKVDIWRNIIFKSRNSRLFTLYCGIQVLKKHLALLILWLYSGYIATRNKLASHLL